MTQSGAAASLGSPLGALGQDDGVQASTPPPLGAGQHVVAITPTEAPLLAQDKAADEDKRAMRDTDGVHLADAAKCKVYVCFKGPLGAQLKLEVRDRISKGEYVEIFSLLPLEK